MEMYFIKSAACLAILLLFYKILLEKEHMHVFKRIFLLVAPIISFGIPLITFPEYTTFSSEGSTSFSTISISETAAEFPLFEVLLISGYILGIIFFGSRFVINLRTLLKRAKNNPKVETTGATQVLLREQIIPHTFWSYIYLNREKFVRKEIPKEVMDHEMAHVRQKHTADILFMEILQVFLWFLPLIYLLKKAVKLNHEFLADSAALQKAGNIGLYQQILLSFSSEEQPDLVNSINYQSIKKRFTVMKKQPSQNAVLVRTIIFLPLLAILLYSFSARETVSADPIPTEANDMIQEKATPEMVAEYNAWAKAMKAETGEKAITRTTLDRMRHIFSLMTPEQKKSSEAFPDLGNIVVVRQDRERRNAAAVRERQEEREAMRQERQALREERRAVREEREIIISKENARAAERRGQIPAPPPPPPTPPVPEHANVPSPPPVPQINGVPTPPPPPPSPEEAIKGWIEEGAEFFYNGKKVTGQEALKAVRENNGKNLSVQVRDEGSGKTVRISDNKR